MDELFGLCLDDRDDFLGLSNGLPGFIHTFLGKLAKDGGEGFGVSGLF